MPWLETAPVDQRERFITDHQHGLYSMAGLRERYGICRKTGYKWLKRYESGGRPVLRERSRAPHRCPHRIPDEIAALFCAARAAHPSWGPAKLLDWLRSRHPEISCVFHRSRTGISLQAGHQFHSKSDSVFTDLGHA